MSKYKKTYTTDRISYTWQSDNSGSTESSKSISENENYTYYSSDITFTYPSNDEIISNIMEKYKNREDILNEMKKIFVFDDYCVELLDEYVKNKRDDKIDDIIK